MTGTSACDVPLATNVWTSPEGSDDYPTLGAGGIFGYIYLVPAQTPIVIPDVPKITPIKPSSPSPPPPYATGRCNVHVWEGLDDTPLFYNPKFDVYIQAVITDADGNQIGSGNSGLKWGETLFITSKLANILSVTPHGNFKNKRTNGGGGGIPPRILQEKGPVNFVLGGQSWDSTTNQCSTGKYDNGNLADYLKGLFGFGNLKLPNRQMDCKFDC